jgi:hypothetical protein
LRTLDSEPFVLPRRYNMPGLYGQVTEVCRQAGFTPRPVQKDIWLMQTIDGLVASGIGVALVLASLRNFADRASYTGRHEASLPRWRWEWYGDAATPPRSCGRSSLSSEKSPDCQ